MEKHPLPEESASCWSAGGEEKMMRIDKLSGLPAACLSGSGGWGNGQAGQGAERHVWLR